MTSLSSSSSPNPNATTAKSLCALLVEHIVVTNENYFIFWKRMVENYTLQKEKLPSKTKELYRNVSQPTNKFLKDYRNLENVSVEDFQEFEKMDFSEEKKGYDFTKFFDIWNDDRCCDLDGDTDVGLAIGGSTTLETAVTPLVEAYLHIQIGDTDSINWAKRNIMWVKEYMGLAKKRYPLLCSDYAVGVKYLSILLTIDIFIKEGHPITDSIVNMILSARYGDLTDKSKSMVYIARWLFFEVIESRNTTRSIENLKMITVLDKDNWVWPYVLSMRMRFHRKGQNKFSKPSKEEIKAVSDAVERSSSNNGAPACLAVFCQTLSEILRWRLVNPLRNIPETVGSETFVSNNEMKEFIELKAKDALENGNSDQVCFGEFVRYAEIFCSNFLGTPEYINLAETCYEKCLTLRPKNTKACHKYGLFKLTRRGDVDKAVELLGQAVESGPRNYPAWIDYIKTLLGSHELNQAKLQEAFEAVRNEDGWTEEDKFVFAFLEGCFLFLQGEKEASVNKWMSNIAIASQDSHYAGFKYLDLIKRRHHWPAEASQYLTLENIYIEIEVRMGIAIDSERNQLQMIKNKIFDAMVDKEARRNNNGSHKSEQRHQNRY